MKTIEQQLEDAQTELEAANSANLALLETLSHDLRTPLNSIIGFADMMDQQILGPVDNAHYRTYAQDICSSGRSMLEIMNTVLDRRRFLTRGKSGKDFRHIIELAPDLISICRNGAIQMINPAGANMLGMWPVETLTDRTFSDFVHSDFQHLFTGDLRLLINETTRIPVTLRRPDGGEIDVEIAALAYEDDREGMDDSLIMLMARDVSERNRANRQIAAREDHLQKIMDTVADGIFTMDHSGTIETVNPAAEQIFGYQAGELVGEKINILMPEDTADNHDDYVMGYLQTGESGVIGNRREFLAQRKDGSLFPMEIAVSTLKLLGRELFIGAVRDITERRQNEEKLRKMATTDPLTNMPNRTLFNERLADAVERVERGETKIAVLFVDLDNFKNINDAMGHLTGDQVIQAAGKRLTACARNGDTVAHVGGDEFSVILDGIDEVDIEPFAQSMLTSLSLPYHVEGKEIFTSGSIGVVPYPGTAENINELLKNVDTAIHHAKRQGRANYQFYTSELSSDVQRRMEVESGLRHALENNEFELFYQAKVDLETHIVTGAEALLRWDSPSLGFVSPAEFIPIAEQAGLIVAIGNWVLRNACLEAASWMKLDHPPIQVGVNLSALQFLSGDLSENVHACLTESGLDADLLDLELTESMLVENPEQTIQTLVKLKEHGITISMDDFGTGYSSLSYLTRFPLDSIKVDRAFVTNLPGDKDAVAIARAIVSMSQQLGLHIVAEGIETREQGEFLYGLGCHVGQGYFYSKPVPSEKFSNLVKQGKSAFFPKV
ncbi:MAG: EAL domain-containing protein [Rhodospirillales bacterium]|nr:EAL domain-containing protein [Rhodospirillales bacterium]